MSVGVDDAKTVHVMPPQIEKKNLAAKNLGATEPRKRKAGFHRRGTEDAEFLFKNSPSRPQRLGGEPSDSSDMVPYVRK
jgi:hypothetical protein